jgi:hypothetical protein
LNDLDPGGGRRGFVQDFASLQGAVRERFRYVPVRCPARST